MAPTAELAAKEDREARMSMVEDGESDAYLENEYGLSDSDSEPEISDLIQS